MPSGAWPSYPHELSGGQRQRVMIAMALANDPDLLIADEPTTALDVTIQAEILELMAGLQQRLGMGMVFITHDLNIVRRIAHRVYVMRYGEVVEEGDTTTIFSAPKHPYTKALLEAEPTGRKAPPPADAPKILDGTDIRVTFKLGGGFLSGPPILLRAVDRVSVSLRRGPDHRHRRRIGLGQIDAGPRPVADAAERGSHPFRRARASPARPRGHAAAAQANCRSSSRIRSARSARA